ncbi:MAG: NAD-dependent epimerase/dehydratase family protein, partial [Nitrososphaerales archaeon]
MNEIIQKDVESLAKEFGSSFSGKKVLVTGGAGFLGSWLCDVFVESGAVVVDCLDNLSTSTHRNIEHLKGRMNIITSNVEDANLTENYDYIFDFSSRASPDEYVHHPIETLTANSVGTMRMLELAKRGGSVFVHACHDDQTRVLTQEGFKRHSEVKEGELVFTLNLETKSLELKPVVKVHSYEYKGRMIAFKGRRVDQLVTPNHKMLVETEGHTWKTRYEDAQVVARRSVFRFSRAKQWQGKNIPLKIEGALDDIFYLAGLYIGDRYSDIRTKKTPSVTGYERKEYLQKCRDSLDRFTVPANRGKQQYSLLTAYRNFLYIPTTDKSRQRVEACLNRLKIQWSSHGEFGFIYFGGKQWADLLQQCGMNAHDKHVPSWMLGYEMPCLRSLLQGMIDSDGCVRNEHWASKVITVSERLV